MTEEERARDLELRVAEEEANRKLWEVDPEFAKELGIGPPPSVQELPDGVRGQLRLGPGERLEAPRL